MKQMVLGFGVFLLLLGCDDAAVARLGGIGANPNTGSFREYLVLGSAMSFKKCRARGGLIIQDIGSPMVACDPTVLGPVADPDEFNHPGTATVAVATQ